LAPDSLLAAAPTASREPFAEALARTGRSLVRGAVSTLQVNVGLLCNQSCRHCHLDAGPHRTEVMTAATMDEVVACARRCSFPVVDVTGGAPELVPGIGGLVERLAGVAPRVLFRSNLTALASNPDLARQLARLGVVIVASFPSLSAAQPDAQRGAGVFGASLAALRLLNDLGYGREGSGLELDLVANPAGAFLPPAQLPTETRFRRELARRWGVSFNRLFTFGNAPIGRFREWLGRSGNLDGYLRQLAEGFNPCTLDSLMCRSLLSVAWDGTLYDCDFNLARGLPLGGVRTHVSTLRLAPPPGSAIATGDHCFACTAGSGFT
jgi:radical SAM/Cys-rich protein